MRNTWFVCCAGLHGRLLTVCTIAALALLTNRATAQPIHPKPLRVAESKPVTVKEARFVVVAQTDWQPGKPEKAYPTVAPIAIQLHITNLSKKEVCFSTFNTFGLRLLTEDGKEVKRRGKSKGDIATAPVVLPADVPYALCRRAELRWDDNSKAAELVYHDGTGAQSVIGPLPPGRYKLVFWYSVAPGPRAKPKVGEAPAWVGEVVTNEVPVEVGEGTTRGISSGDLELRPASAAIRLGASKSVTVNDAQFVVVTEPEWKAQPDWKPGKFLKGAPLEMQLRITNLGKKDRLFHTFDTFGVRVSTAEGKKMTRGSARKVTVITRPILLPPGASYVLGHEPASNRIHRRAELDWNVIAKEAEFRYYDGTGSVHLFEPLGVGQYKLAFWYEVRPQGLLNTERDPESWIGSVVTEEITVRVRNP